MAGDRNLVQVIDDRVRVVQTGRRGPPGAGVDVQDEGVLVVANVGVLNFEGAAVTVTQDPSGTAKITITGGGGGGSALTVKSNGVTVDAAVDVLDYSSQFGISEGPDHEINVTVAALDAAVIASGTLDNARLDGDLAALAALATTGLSARTAANTWALRTIATSGGGIAVVDGDGVAGNPTLSIDSDLVAIAALATTSYGRDFLTLANAAAALAYIGTYSTTTIDSLIAAAAAGVAQRATVRVATTGNITLSGEQTLDGVLTSADLVLVRAQTAPEENGIYVSAAGAWARSAQFDTFDEYPGALIAVQEGATLSDSLWMCMSNAGGTLGVTAITFQRLVTSGELLAANNLSDLVSVATARDNLGVEIGVDVQAFDPDLAALAALGLTGFAVRTAADTWAQRSIAVTSPITVSNGDGVAGNPTIGAGTALTDLATRWNPASASGPAFLDFAEDTDNGTNRIRLIAPASVAADRTITLPDETGTVFTSAEPELAALAGLVSAADRVPYFTGSGTAALATLTSLGRARIAQLPDTFSDADKSISAGTGYLAQTGTMSAPRTATLPAASSYVAGEGIEIADRSGSVTAVNTITIARAGADLIDGVTSIVISAAYGARKLISDGVSTWTVVASTLDVLDILDLPIGDRADGTEYVPASQGGNDVRLPVTDLVGSMFDAIASASGDRYRTWEDLDHLVAANTTDATYYGSQYAVLYLNVGGGAGAGAAAQQSAVELLGGHSVYGVGQLTTGTGTTARASISTLHSLFAWATASYVRFLCRIRIPTISTGAQTFIVRAGFTDATSGVLPTNGGVYVEANTNANWQCYTDDDTTRTTTDSGVAVSNAAYVNIGIEYDGDGTVRFYMSTGTSPMVQVAAHTTNFPDVGTVLAPVVAIVKSAGGTARTLNIDGFGWDVPQARGLSFRI